MQIEKIATYDLDRKKNFKKSFRNIVIEYLLPDLKDIFLNVTQI